MNNTCELFETAFAQWLGVSRAFSFWKGRVALYAILKALGIGPGDEVVLPGYTCVMDVNPIKYLGAKPVYVDIEPTTYNIDTNLLRERITDKTKVIVAQHTYGYPCEMDAIMSLADQHGIVVVEDCCLAMGSTYKGKLCGTFGRAAYWSFQWNKPFTTGLGGMITTSDPDLAGKIERLCRDELCQPSFGAATMLALQRLVYRLFIFPRTTAWATNLFRWLTEKGLVIGSSSSCEFVPDMAEGFFVGMSAGQARAGLRQVRKINKNIAHRKRLKLVYDKLLSQAGWQPSIIPEYMDTVLVRYPVRFSNKQKALAEAPAHGVEIGSWFECPLHPQETPLYLYDYEPGMCPVAEKASEEVINLPLHPRVTEKDARKTVAFIASIV